MAESTQITQNNDYTILPQQPDKNEGVKEEPTVFKVYRRRWFMLLFLFFYYFANVTQIYGYAVIADLLVKYYEVSFTMAEWATTFGLIVHAITFIPGSYLLDKLGLRNCVIIGLIGTAVGSWIKVFSIGQSRFWVLLIGKSFISIFQVFVAAVPSKFAGMWFGNDQVSTALFIGIIEIELSYSFGMYMVTSFVQQGTIEEIGTGLQNLAYFTAIYPTILIPLLILFFTNAPPTPPSITQVRMGKEKTKSILKSLRIFATNRSFLVFSASLGISTGIIQTFFINSSQMMAYYHPNDTHHVGNLMILTSVGGIIGALILGRILDKYGCFKKATIFLFISVTILSIIHLTTMMFDVDVRILYVTAFIMGLFCLPQYSIGYSVGIELTYPEPECVSGTILLVTVYLFSLPISQLHSCLFTVIGATWANIILYFITIAGNCLLLGVRFDLRRQMVEIESSKKIKMPNTEL